MGTSLTIKSMLGQSLSMGSVSVMINMINMHR
jgi:hypothetical protein